jgi:uncharacterized protein (DUF952 family)
MTIILHICSAQTWNEARRRGEYRADSLSTEGFIHCSTLEQVAKTANRFYAGQTGLVLLVIEAERVLAAIRYEAADADLFPHVYGPINLDAVLEVQPFSPAADGTFEPPHLSSW